MFFMKVLWGVYRCRSRVFVTLHALDLNCPGRNTLTCSLSGPATALSHLSGVLEGCLNSFGLKVTGIELKVWQTATHDLM